MKEDRTNGGYSWKIDKGWFMVRCHKCLIENYAMSVASGQCAWCGYDRNTKEN